MKTLFHEDTSGIVQVNGRELQLTDSRKVENYRKGIRERIS